MKIKQTALITTLLLSAGSVSAASLDFRQEYKHDTEKYASRIKLGAGVGNYYFGVEAMQKGHMFSDWASNGNEFDFGYKYKINKHWMLIPGMPITFASGHVTFKPQLRVQYKFDSGLTAKLRYRHEFRRFTDEKNRGVERASKITANLNYNYKYLQLGLEGNFGKGHDNQVFFDNGDTNWDLLFQIGYKGKDWNVRPYAEFGNVSVSSTSSDRQLRSRVGITYSF